MPESRRIRGSMLLKVVVVATAIIVSGTARADQVTFANGDRISGQIIHVLDNEIQIATEYAGTVCADFDAIADMKTDVPGKIMLVNGDIVTGTIQSISSEFVIIESEELGALNLARDRFSGYMMKEHAGILPVESDKAGGAAATSEQEQQPSATPSATKEAAVPDYWSGSLAFGLALQRGNTDTTDLRTEVKATRKAEREELNLRFYSNYGETDGETDQNDVFGQAKLKFLKTDRLYFFGSTDMEYDEREQLDLRAQVFGGLGYKLIDYETTTLLAEAGAGLTGEFYDNDGEEESLEGSVILGAEFMKKLFEYAVFTQGVTLFPSLSNAGDYRVRSETSLTSPLGDRWAVKLSLIDEYDSNPQNEDVKKNDMRLISALEYTF